MGTRAEETQTSNPLTPFARRFRWLRHRATGRATSHVPPHRATHTHQDTDARVSTAPRSTEWVGRARGYDTGMYFPTALAMD